MSRKDLRLCCFWLLISISADFKVERCMMLLHKWKSHSLKNDIKVGRSTKKEERFTKLHDTTPIFYYIDMVS